MKEYIEPAALEGTRDFLPDRGDRCLSTNRFRSVCGRCPSRARRRQR